jgi:tellurite resistance protein
MTDRYDSPITATIKLTVLHLGHRDEEVMQALVTAGAFVALADGQLEAVERDELVNFIDRQGFVPTILRDQIAEAFDNRARRVKDRDGANVAEEALRPLAGRSLAPVVVRTAERVAAADFAGQGATSAVPDIVMRVTSALGFKVLQRLFCIAVALIAISAAARAAMKVELSEYRAGTLVLRGRIAEPHETVTLDGVYRARSDQSGAFEFRIHYRPHACAVRLISGTEIFHATVANCSI